ncbi:hypothetical protein ES708_33681 [subsurface metagenome]
MLSDKGDILGSMVSILGCGIVPSGIIEYLRGGIAICLPENGGIVIMDTGS